MSKSSDSNNKAKEIPALSNCNMEEIFIASELLPDATEAFIAHGIPLDEAIKTSDVVLDTNVLLLPYGAGSSSLKDITDAFKKLKSDNRLYIPAQVAREFIKLRPNKISELHNGLADKISRFVEIDEISYPIFEDIEGYKELNDLIKKTKELKKDLKTVNNGLLQKIKGWGRNDPVSSSYRDVFTSDCIVEPEIDKEKTVEDLLKRKRLSISPGYKDFSKDDLGIGDYLIWKTILKIAEDNKKNLIFVSGDEKADWQHQTSNVGFLPKYELLYEYRRSSKGKSFYIVPLSKLLELLSVDNSSIEEIKQEEVRIQDANTVTVTVPCPNCEFTFQWRLEHYSNASAKPQCPECKESFHIHRTHDSFIVRKANDRSARRALQSLEEDVSCPSCQNNIRALLGSEYNATAWCQCESCDTTFPIHRIQEGGIKIGRLNKNN